MSGADLALACACGAFRGAAVAASALTGNRLVCYCDDCQAFAHYLERAGDVLDAHGGTDLFQTSPARLAIEKGGDRLACIRLRPGGLLRWYAACCRWPVGNTMASRGLPFVGLVLPRRDATPARDALLGPARGGVHGRFAKGDRSGLDAHDGAPLGQVLRIAGLLLRWRLRGEHRRSPFFAADGAPVATPEVLSAEVLRRVEAARDAA